MRVLIETRKNGDGWDIAYHTPQGKELASAHHVARCQAPNQHLPTPFAHPGASCDAVAHTVCEDATGAAALSAHENVRRVDVAPGAVATFGRYLFQVLLGESWAKLEALHGATEEIELEILIHGDAQGADVDLSGLPWEMMHGPQGPLGAQLARKVSIARVIEPAKELKQPEKVQLPLRVLFIVGRQIDDALRPGAELIGLLRRLQMPLDAEFKNFQTTDIHVRFLSEATWDEIETLSREFAPSVVHIVSHGLLDGGARLLLTARAEDGRATSPKTRDTYPCSAQRLLELITVKGAPPPVVIINACHSADTGEEGADFAFAAELVRGGVAMALGMSGEVADRTCQVFAMRFYQALLQGVAAPLASAQGRRAALLAFPEDMNKAEWARPTLFLAKGIEPALGFAPAVRDVSSIAQRCRTLRVPEALCDRYDCLQRYEDFRRSIPLQPGSRAAIAFVAKDPAGGLGKTRLLEEIAARSVFDDFIPVIVRHDQQNLEAPQNMLEMARQISDAIEQARANFGLKPRPANGIPYIQQFAFELMGITPNPGNPVKFGLQKTELNGLLRTNRTSGKPADLKLTDVLPLIHADCEELRAAVQDTGPPQTILLLLDDLHRYAGCGEAILPRIGEFGLGHPDLPIPVVFTCEVTDTEGKTLEDLLRDKQFRTFPLNAFESAVDQRLTCNQFLMGKWKHAVSSRRDKREDVEFFFESMHEFTQGKPKQYWRAEVEGAVKMSMRNRTLVPADFEMILARWK